MPRLALASTERLTLIACGVHFASAGLIGKSAKPSLAHAAVRARRSQPQLARSNEPLVMTRALARSGPRTGNEPTVAPWLVPPFAYFGLTC
jgi:hypothetical protein